MNTVLDYLQSESAAQANILNLDLDFSTATTEQISEFCTWLRTHPYLERIEFRSAHRPSTGVGADLSLLSSTVFRQIFTAIRDNPRIQTIMLPQCNLTHLIDVEALENLKDCLVTKKDITIIANRNTPLLNNGTLAKTVSLIAIGKAEKLKLREIISNKTSLTTVRTFLTNLTNATDKEFQYVSLPHNHLKGDVLPEIANLANLQITSLDLSENPLALGASLEDWKVFFTTIQNNGALKSLSLKSCELWRSPISLEEEEATEEQCLALFQNMLLKFVRETHLSALDLDLNEWDDEFLEKLHTAAQHNAHFYYFKCGHHAEPLISLANKAGSLGKFPSGPKIRRDSESTGRTSQEDTSIEDHHTASSLPGSKSRY